MQHAYDENLATNRYFDRHFDTEAAKILPGEYFVTDKGMLLVTVLGSSAAVVQPALFYHPQAFAMASVKLPKLYSTDTVAVTEDGISLRVSRYADGDANTQKVRFDLLPAFGTMNPFFAGQGFGT